MAHLSHASVSWLDRAGPIDGVSPRSCVEARVHRSVKGAATPKPERFYALAPPSAGRAQGNRSHAAMPERAEAASRLTDLERFAYPAPDIQDSGLILWGL